MKNAMRSMLLLVAVCGAASACASREPLFSRPIVSMTEGKPPAAGNAASGTEITETYCPGDPVSGGGDPKSVGLIDEAIRKAQANRARWIKDAQFFREGNCVVVGQAIQ